MPAPALPCRLHLLTYCPPHPPLNTILRGVGRALFAQQEFQLCFAPALMLTLPSHLAAQGVGHALARLYAQQQL